MTSLGFQQAIEPRVSLRESGVARGAWSRLERAFSCVERASWRRLSATKPVVNFEDGPVLCLHPAGGSLVATLYESTVAHTASQRIDWSEPGAIEGAPGFVRLWRAGVEELFCEDIGWLADAGMDVFGRGAVVGVRFSDQGLWEDLDARRVERLVAMCRQAAAHMAADDLAA